MRIALTLVLLGAIHQGPAVAQSTDGALAPRAAPRFGEPAEPVAAPRAAPPQPPPTVVAPPPVEYGGRWVYAYDGGPPVAPDARADRLRWFRYGLTCGVGPACDPEASASLPRTCDVDEMMAFAKDCPAPVLPPPWANSVIR